VPKVKGRTLKPFSDEEKEFVMDIVTGMEDLSHHSTPSSCMKYRWIQLSSFMNPWVGAIQDFMHEADLPKKEDCSLRSPDLITSCQRAVYRSVLSFFNLMFNFLHLHTLGSGFLGLFRVWV
jgi:hypothetical protein